MKTRIAATSLVVGLILAALAMVRYVTARDVQRQEPTAALQDIPAILGLLSGAAVLVAGGVAAMTRRPRPVMRLLAGMVLLGTSGVAYLHAIDVQRREQAVLDREWAGVNRQAAERFPRALPGARPGPARLSGKPVILGLLVSGVLLCGCGLRALRPRKLAGV